jgi:hypothetical protein
LTAKKKSEKRISQFLCMHPKFIIQLQSQPLNLIELLKLGQSFR